MSSLAVPLVNAGIYAIIGEQAVFVIHPSYEYELISSDTGHSYRYCSYNNSRWCVVLLAPSMLSADTDLSTQSSAQHSLVSQRLYSQ
jgi:hypothetical protein